MQVKQAEVEKGLQEFGKIMDAGIDIYERPRLENEIDLVAHVRELLVRGGCLDRVLMAYDTSRHIREAQGLNANAQQHHLNRYFTMQLMTVDAETRFLRYNLLYNVSPADWLGIFETQLLNRIIGLGLPVAVA